jgi:hypothetical protein
MKNHSSVPSAIKNLKQIANLNSMWSAIPRNNDTFVNFAVMAHISTGTLKDIY